MQQIIKYSRLYLIATKCFGAEQLNMQKIYILFAQTCQLFYEEICECQGSLTLIL